MRPLAIMWAVSIGLNEGQQVWFRLTHKIKTISCRRSHSLAKVYFVYCHLLPTGATRITQMKAPWSTKNKCVIWRGIQIKNMIQTKEKTRNIEDFLYSLGSGQISNKQVTKSPVLFIISFEWQATEKMEHVFSYPMRSSPQAQHNVTSQFRKMAKHCWEMERP